MTAEIIYSRLIILYLQVMVFVHARNGTLRTAENLIKLAQESGRTKDFMPDEGADVTRVKKEVSRSRNKRLVELFDSGFGVHHAGLLRSDRWGINLGLEMLE